MRQPKHVYNARYRAKRKGKVAQARARRNWQCKRKYGLTLSQRNQMYDNQHGLCGLCNKPLPQESMSNNCDLDHNHNTNKARSLVHRKCNLIIGFMECNPELAQAVPNYLAKHSL